MPGSPLSTSNLTLTLAFSPCPNDCFIFDALVHDKIDTEGLRFKVLLEDVETLNEKAFKGEVDITKLSFHAYAYLTEKYVLLDAGSALGNSCGPLLISKRPVENSQEEIEKCSIAIPGKYTTANLLLKLAFPGAKNKTEIVFSAIEGAVLNEEVDLGVIIHENRFTYEQKGLQKVVDLGEFWEEKMKAPIPLGGIVIKRSLPEELKQKVNRVLKRSVEFAFANPDASREYVKAHAQEMSEEVMYKHIALYVNEYSVNLGAEGRRAVELLFDKAQALGVIGKIEHSVFL
jgi:1,4-dihydroxy-6-naphthoate synthase